ncbi:MAG: serine--tRNA ligase [Proteobacteria bacterium]|nr:serine--tRNA ligase [Pseudomonadota bacterium]
MIDPRLLSERRDEIAESCRRRGSDVDVDAAMAAHSEVARRQTERNEANRRRNEHQKAGKRKLEPDEREAHNNEGRRLKQAVAGLEAAVRESQEALDQSLRAIPNFIHPDVPEGGEEDFAVLRQWGEPPNFSFEPVDHLVICERLGLVDFERAAKVAGQKFAFLVSEAAVLEMALQRYALDLVRAEGYVPYSTPDLARPEIVDAMGYSPRGAETQVYSLANANLCLIGTAEIPLGGLHADTILDEADLPLRLAGISHCFRTEAGTHGRESKGLYRVHQFSKVEMFVYCRPEESEAILEELVAIEEKIFQGLEIPYRVIDVASGDLGAPAYRKIDLEAWMPGRGEGGDWGEITSASNCTDYQARRLHTRFRRAETKKNEMVHTLNGTAVACARTIVAILENHQGADGSIAIPKALQPHMGCEKIGPRASGAKPRAQ